jgi:MSHA biogenesis protein MshJ
LIAAAVVGGVLLLGFSLLVDPALSRARIAERQITQTNSELAAIQAQLQVVRTQLQVDPDAGRRSEIEGLKKDAADADAAIRKIQSGLVPPEEMNALLERLLAKNAGLRLLSLKSLPPLNLAESVAESMRGNDKAAPVAAGAGLFKHGVELKLEGSYSEVHDWLRQLEEAPQKVLWGDVRYVVGDYPRAQVILTVFTLSLDRSWLAI